MHGVGLWLGWQEVVAGRCLPGGVPGHVSGAETCQCGTSAVLSCQPASVSSVKCPSAHTAASHAVLAPHGSSSAGGLPRAWQGAGGTVPAGPWSRRGQRGRASPPEEVGVAPLIALSPVSSSARTGGAWPRPERALFGTCCKSTRTFLPTPGH